MDLIKASLPELPDQKRDRFIKEFALTKYDAGLLTGAKSMSQFFEEAVSDADGKIIGKTVANLLIGEAARLINDAGIDISASKFEPKHFSNLGKMIIDKAISVTAAKQIISILYVEGGEVGLIVEREGLKQVNDLSAIEPIIEKIINDNPKQAEEFRAGKDKLIGFFVGQVMKVTHGKVNPGMLQDLVIKKLGEK